jgi:hypothetical protein
MAYDLFAVFVLISEIPKKLRTPSCDDLTLNISVNVKAIVKFIFHKCS